MTTQQPHRQQKQRQAPKKKRKQKITWLELSPVFGILAFTCGVIGYVYSMYGACLILIFCSLGYVLLYVNVVLVEVSRIS